MDMLKNITIVFLLITVQQLNHYELPENSLL